MFLTDIKFNVDHCQLDVLKAIVKCTVESAFLASFSYSKTCFLYTLLAIVWPGFVHLTLRLFFFKLHHLIILLKM